MHTLWSFNSQEKLVTVWCHQMSDFKAEMDCIRLMLGPLRLSPQTPLGELTTLPRHLAVFKGPTSKGTGKKMEGNGKGREGERRGKEEDKGREGGAREKCKA